MTKNFSIAILAKYLAISLLICFSYNDAFAQNKNSKGKGKDKKDKKEYPMKVKMWQLDDEYSIKDYSLESDTSLHLFQNYDYNDKSSISYSNTGNMGSPYIYNIFDDRERARKSPVFFFNSISDFVSKPEDTKFYQVNHPYTWLYYATTPKSRNGQVIDFTHTQNINKKFNWGFNLGLVGSTGRISHQHTKNVTLNPQINYVGKHLSVHFFYNYTKSIMEENGGIDASGEVNPKRFKSLMSSPFSEWGRRSWNLVTEYSIGKTDFQIINDSTRNEIYTPKLTFGYRFQFDKMFRTYTNENDVTEKHNRGTQPIYDSLFYHRITNEFHLKIAENQLLGLSPGISGAIGVESEYYYYFKDYQSPNKGDDFNNVFLEGRITKNKSKNMILNGMFRQYMTGYNSGDMFVNGNLGLKLYSLKRTKQPKMPAADSVSALRDSTMAGTPAGVSSIKNNEKTSEIKTPAKPATEIPEEPKYYLKASLDFYNQTPTYFEKYYYSANFAWENKFDRMKTIRIGGELGAPKWHFKIGASLYTINDYVYIGSDGKPAQESNINVQSISLQKDFFVGPFRFANRLTYQNADKKSLLNIPDFAVYHSTYLEFFLVKNVLLTQVGGEVHWSTEYNAFNYAPGTSLFYPSNNDKVGNYPLLNGFANIKIRGVLMFFKWENIGNGLIKDYYYSTNVYPYQDFHFMFGILWRFGD